MTTPNQILRAHMLKALLPPGPIWDGVEPLLLAVAGAVGRFQDFLEAVPSDYLPDTCSEEFAVLWERSLGLDAGSLTLEQRRAQIISQLRGGGDPTLANLQAAADAWNVGAVVEELLYPLFKMGVGAMGDPLRGDAWAFTLKITYTGPASPAFEAAMLRLIQFQNYIVFEVV